MLHFILVRNNAFCKKCFNFPRSQIIMWWRSKAQWQLRSALLPEIERSRIFSMAFLLSSCLPLSSPHHLSFTSNFITNLFIHWLLMCETFFVNNTSVHSFPSLRNPRHITSTNNTFIVDTLFHSFHLPHSTFTLISKTNIVQLRCATTTVNPSTTFIHTIGQCLQSLLHATRISHQKIICRPPSGRSPLNSNSQLHEASPLHVSTPSCISIFQY